MAIFSYCTQTSVAPGGSLSFPTHNTAPTTNISLVAVRLGGGAPNITGNFVSGPQATAANADQTGANWGIPTAVSIPAGQRSGVYLATLTNSAGESTQVSFVVRGTSASIAIHIPVSTYQAYNGFFGQSLYGNEEPTRARRVSFDRPVQAITGPERAFVEWIEANGFAADYATSVDLHATASTLNNRRLFISIGHDEYWSKEMRDNVENFIRSGGNAAFFSGNTCWWQVRFEAGNRQMVCYRDAIEDPLHGVDDARVTTHWTSAPVFRPENTLTGVSYRKGSGGWIGSAWTMARYQVEFSGHWVFEGTGLVNGALFAAGGVGYETDAAEFVREGGVPRITGRDGTPPSFVVLASADLQTFRSFGQGGMATMGIFRNVGTVFTAASVNWGDRLSDSIVSRITRNVINKLCFRFPANQWELIGGANNVVAMAGCENTLFCATNDNRLWARAPVPQNILWTEIGHANWVTAMASPIEAAGDRAVGLFCTTTDHRLWWRSPVLSSATWELVGAAPANVVALAACNYFLFAATSSNRLWVRPTSGGDVAWTDIGHANNVRCMAATNGKLYCVTGDDRLWWRQPVHSNVNWTELGPGGGAIALAGHAGQLYAATAANTLLRRDAF